MVAGDFLNELLDCSSERVVSGNLRWDRFDDPVDFVTGDAARDEVMKPGVSSEGWGDSKTLEYPVGHEDAEHSDHLRGEKPVD